MIVRHGAGCRCCGRVARLIACRRVRVNPARSSTQVIRLKLYRNPTEAFGVITTLDSWGQTKVIAGARDVERTGSEPGQFIRSRHSRYLNHLAIRRPQRAAMFHGSKLYDLAEYRRVTHWIETA